jgi:hypothetical protein
LWFQQKRKSPKTGNQLADLRLIPNIALRQLIDDYRAKNGLPVVDVPRSPPAASPAGAGGGYGYGGGGGARADVRFDFLRNAVGPSGMTAEEADLLGLVITAHQAQHFDELAKRLRAWPSSPPHTLVFISESMSFARNHGESRIRRELIAHIPDYVSRHTTMHGLHESTLALLVQCAEHDDCAACRKKAIEACYTLYKACPAVRRSMDLAAFFLRRLRPWHRNTGKRMVKAPRLYIRDSGLVHELLGIGSAEALAGHPVVGASWEGFALEQVLAKLPKTDAWFWGTQGGAELDLFVKSVEETLREEHELMSAKLVQS